MVVGRGLGRATVTPSRLWIDARVAVPRAGRRVERGHALPHHRHDQMSRSRLMLVVGLAVAGWGRSRCSRCLSAAVRRDRRQRCAETVTSSHARLPMVSSTCGRVDSGDGASERPEGEMVQPIHPSRWVDVCVKLLELRYGRCEVDELMTSIGHVK